MFRNKYDGDLERYDCKEVEVGFDSAHSRSIGSGSANDTPHKVVSFGGE